jgi:hypothetical protein
LAPKIQEQGSRGIGGGGPSPPGMGAWSTAEILTHIEMLEKQFYTDAKKKPPRIHCVGYQSDPGAEEFLKSLAYGHHGRFRRIKALVKPIQP